jgi:sugar phosphate permease
MANIFRRGERGTAMGLWATSYQVGGLAASGLATWVLVHFGWRASFIVPAVLTAAVGLAVMRWLWEGPPAPQHERRKASLEVVREPLLWALAAAYFCIKLIRYTLIFWLPYFYERALHYDSERAGYLSISFDLGGVAGAIVGGRLFDRTGRFRGWLIVILACGLAVGTSLYSRAALSGPLAAFAGMVLVGALLFGPDALVSSMAAQDLGGSAGAGTAAGFINGIGSVGAALQGILIGEVASRYGWNAVFWMFGLLSVTAALMVVPYAVATQRQNQGIA